MAIEKNSFKVSRIDSEFSPHSKDSMSSDDEEFQRRSSAVESDDDDEFDDCDSGAGSDDFDLLELGETREEFCQFGDQTCSIPFELYDLPGLGDVLSMDVWNDILTEEDRFNLAKYLPDVDQETFMRTLKELFMGSNLHFGSPVTKLFNMLKGGLCEPRVALYRQGLNFFQKCQHYHLLRKHQNSMVANFYQIRDAWLNCRGYSIGEKLRVLNIMQSQKSLMNENMELGSDSSEREESGDASWSKKLKDWKHGQKVGRYAKYQASPAREAPSRDRQMALAPAKCRKQNPKGTLKFAGLKKSSKELGSRAVAHYGLEMKLGPFGSEVPFHRQNEVAGYGSQGAVRIRAQFGDPNNAEEPMPEVAVHKDRNFSRAYLMDRPGAFKAGKKQDVSGEEYDDSYVGFPIPLKNDIRAYSANRTVNQLSDIKVLTSKPSSARPSYDYGKKVNYSENVQQFAVDDQMRYGKGRPLSSKGSRMELSEAAEPLWQSRAQGESFPVDPSLRYGDWHAKGKKWKMERDSPDLRVTDSQLNTKYRANLSHEEANAIYTQNGGPDMANIKGIRMLAKSEETESDSSEQIEEDEDDNPLLRSKWAYPSGFSDMKSGPDPKKAKLGKKDKKDNARPSGKSSHSSRKMFDFSADLHMAGVEDYPLKAKKKGRMHDVGLSNSSGTKDLEASYFSGPGRSNGDDDWKQAHKLGRNAPLQKEHGERFHIPSLKPYSPDRRWKGDGRGEYPVPPFLRNYIEEEDDAPGTHQWVGDSGSTARLGKKGQIVESYNDDCHEISDAQLLGCSSVTKKQRPKDEITYMDEQDENYYLNSHSQQQLDDNLYSKKRGKRKLEDDSGDLDKDLSEPTVTDLAEEDVELDPKPHKKPFTLITPTVHTGFSFSIVHLLSAVRMALITLLPEDSLEVGKHLNDGRGKTNENANDIHSHGNLETNNSENSGLGNLPSLTVQEIVNRVKSNPGDPCILETQEPLQDLVRGVLKIFSSKTAPLGAKGWKPLASYEKSTKCWSWIGPLSQSLSDHEAVEEVTSPEAWGLPHKMLVKLVDSFANWLKSGQETLQQIGSLPAPPLTLMQLNLDEKERFRDLRAQKSLTTISPSSEEVREYFRKEEVLRYSIPDRAFSYTAVDGKRSIVAPLRRCGGKPTSKARDHFMLKRDRPPHVTILCLVRDAAARLPGSIGTRADVCTLIRDSQYIVEDVSDAQVNQVVSGALDRLHYERDPCVQFDGERKLWVYLHREREEEDFEDDGTSSTKKWKRQKKEASESFDQGTVTVAYHGAGEQTGIDLSSDLNVEAPFTDDDKRMEFTYYDDRHHLDDNIEKTHASEQGGMQHGSSTAWGTLGLNSMPENKLLCQENSTNEDFDDETFGREQTAELLSTSLS